MSLKWTFSGDSLEERASLTFRFECEWQFLIPKEREQIELKP